MSEAQTAWLWVSRFGKISKHKRLVVDANAAEDNVDRHLLTADTAWKSLSEWYQHYQPALISEHNHTGASLGVATGETRRLDPAEMRGLITPEMLPEHAAKICAQTDDGFFAEFRLTDPETSRQYQRGQLLYCSPHVLVGHTDDSQVQWPLAHLENSLTTGPVQSSQIPMTALIGARLSHNQGSEVDTEGTPEPVMKDAALNDAARLDAMEAQIATLAEQSGRILEMLEAMAPAPEPDQPTESDEVMSLRAELAEANTRADEAAAKVATAEADARRVEATAHVATLSLTDDGRAELVEMAATNPDGYALSIKFVEPLAADQPNTPPPFAGSEELSAVADTPQAEHAAIKAHQRAAKEAGQVLSFTQARSQYRAASNGGR